MKATVKILKTCKQGHQFYKSSDCPTCPICEELNKPKDNFLSLLSAPARRALENNGIQTLKQLSKFTEAQILEFHGMGKSSIPKLRDVLKANALSFKTPKVIKSKEIDQYISTFPKETQKIMNQIRATIRKAAPEAEEVISYKMPAYKFHGMLVYFAAYANHIGFYALPKVNQLLQKELSVYKSGKGSIQFPLNQPMPYDLITKIVKLRVMENLKKAKNK